MLSSAQTATHLRHLDLSPHMLLASLRALVLTHSTLLSSSSRALLVDTAPSRRLGSLREHLGRNRNRYRCLRGTPARAQESSRGMREDGSGLVLLSAGSQRGCTMLPATCLTRWLASRVRLQCAATRQGCTCLTAKAAQTSNSRSWLGQDCFRSGPQQLHIDV